MTSNAAGAHSHGWKLKRVSLMKLVCVETARMEAVRVQQLPYVFQRLPLNTRGNLPLSEVCLSLTQWPIPQLYPHICWGRVEGRLQAPTTTPSELAHVGMLLPRLAVRNILVENLSWCTCTWHSAVEDGTSDRLCSVPNVLGVVSAPLSPLHLHRCMCMSSIVFHGSDSAANLQQALLACCHQPPYGSPPTVTSLCVSYCLPVGA